MNATAETTSKPPAIEMRGVTAGSLKNPGLAVADEIEWSAAQGDFWVIGGPQRVGKTDFLMMAGGLSAPHTGSYRCFGEQMPIFEDTRMRDRLRIGFVFDGGTLFNRMTVLENVALPVRFHQNLSLAEARTIVDPLLAALGLTPYAEQFPASVSWNFQKRAGLARALAHRPDLLLLDSPLSGLSPRNALWWLQFLTALNQGHELSDGKPVTIVATADDFRPWQNHARQFACLSNRKLLTLGDWAAVEQCQESTVRELLQVPQH